MGRGITVSTMAKSIRVIMHFVLMVISKTHFHMAAVRLRRIHETSGLSKGCPLSSHTETLEARELHSPLPAGWHLSRSSAEDRIGSKDGEELSSKEHEVGARRFGWGWAVIEPRLALHF